MIHSLAKKGKKPQGDYLGIKLDMPYISEHVLKNQFCVYALQLATGGLSLIRFINFVEKKMHSSLNFRP